MNGCVAVCVDMPAQGIYSESIAKKGTGPKEERREGNSAHELGNLGL